MRSIFRVGVLFLRQGENGIINSAAISKYFVVPNADNPVTPRFQKGCSSRIPLYLTLFIVLRPIQFDNDLRTMACEISHVWADRYLSAKVESKPFEIAE